MTYIHIRNLEKFHPGYKDRQLQWAKIHFKMVQGDPDCDLINNEIDWGRLIKMILLELEAQQPLPNIDAYWVKKGFDIKKRPMSMTLQVLHNFWVSVQQESKTCVLDKSKNKSKSKSREEEDSAVDVLSRFEQLWRKYPNKDGRKAAARSFMASVKTEQDWEDINIALTHYLQDERVQRGFIKNGSTWFNNWRDWISGTISKPTVTGAQANNIQSLKNLMEEKNDDGQGFSAGICSDNLCLPGNAA